MKFEDIDFSRAVFSKHSRSSDVDMHYYKLIKVDGCFIGLRCYDNSCEMLQTRRDLYQYSGGFAWGVNYKGTGANFLAISILADYFENNSIIRQPTNEEIGSLIDNILSKLDSDDSHIIKYSAIASLIS